MENKINITELLKNCPKGMELYSPIFGKVYLDKIIPHLAIRVTTDKKQGNFKKEFLYDGRYGMNGECMLFPSKDQRDWSKFQRPFKDGDIVVTTLGNIAIIRKPIGEEVFYVYVLMVGNSFYKDETPKVSVERLATKEEKQRLFDAIKANGYEWNAETKTLEKIEIESRCTYKEFIHYLADKAIGDKREIIKAFDNNEHNRFIGYLQVTKRLINGKLFILFKVDGRELEAEWQASSNYGVWQQCGICGDDYSGYLLFPTYEDNEYFVLWYKC